jgi:hypothetical protein
VLLAFATGAGLGLFFHRDDFLGGYNSFRRRIVRLGHIALAALGMLNVIFSDDDCTRFRRKGFFSLMKAQRSADAGVVSV